LLWDMVLSLEAILSPQTSSHRLSVIAIFITSIELTYRIRVRRSKYHQHQLRDRIVT
jgi:hypothetical protein